MKKYLLVITTATLLSSNPALAENPSPLVGGVIGAGTGCVFGSLVGGAMGLAPPHGRHMMLKGCAAGAVLGAGVGALATLDPTAQHPSREEISRIENETEDHSHSSNDQIAEDKSEHSEEKGQEK